MASFSDVIVANAGGIGTGTPGQLAYFSGVNVVSGAGGTILTATGALTVASLAIGVTGSGFSSGGALTATSGTFSLPSAVNSTLVMGGVAFGNVLAGIAFVQNTTSGTAAGSALYFGNDTGALGVGYVAGYSSVHSTKPSYLEIMNTQNAPMTLGTNGVVRMTIAAAGSVSFGSNAVGMGALTATKGTFSGGSQIMTWSGQTTNGQYLSAINAGAFLVLGIDTSVGGLLFVGSPAYSSSVGTGNNTAFCIATNNTVRVTISGAGGVTLSSTLQVGSLGAFASGDKYVIADASGNFHLSALGPPS